MHIDNYLEVTRGKKRGGILVNRGTGVKYMVTEEI